MDAQEGIKGRRSREREKRRLEEAVTEVSEAVNQTILRLQGCRNRILEMRQDGLEKGFREEQMKACNEVNQLKALINQLDVINQRVPAEYAASFDSMMTRIRQRVDQEVSLFHIDLRPVAVNHSEEMSDMGAKSSYEKQVQGNMSLEADVRSSKKLLNDFNRLQRDLTDLNDMIGKLSTCVLQQRETVDNIEDNISSAKHNVERGALTLSKIKKGAALPLIGAAVGTAFAGPIGMVVGFKLAAVAAIGTTAAGYYGGKVAQKMTTPPDITFAIQGNPREEDDKKDVVLNRTCSPTRRQT